MAFADITTASYKLSESTYFQQKDQDVLAVDTDSGMWLRTNQTGSRILKMCLEKKDFNQIIDILSKEEKLPAEMLKEPIAEFLKDAIESNVLFQVGNEPEYKDTFLPLNRVVLHLTNACNLQCIHCYNRNKTGKEWLEPGEWLILINELKKYKISEIIISGGEPLLYKGFYDAIPDIDDEENNILTLVTNGTLIDEFSAAKIKQKFKYVSVSIDGPNEEIYSKIRGDGYFKKVIESIKLLKNAGVQMLSIHTIIMQLNKDKAVDMLDLACDLECDISFGRFIPTRPEMTKWQITGDEYYNITHDIYDKYRKIHEKLSATKKYIPALKFDASARGQSTRMVFHKKPLNNCAAAEIEFSVSPDGSVFPCPFIQGEEYKIGNCRNQDIAGLRKAGCEFSSSITLEKISGCSSCYLRRMCGGGCRAVGLNNDNSIFGHDQYCSAYKRFFEDALWTMG